MATLLELAQFSDAVYGDGGKPPEGWTLLDSYTMAVDGYFGQAYKRGQEIVITNRGTRLKSLADLLTDVQIGLLQRTGAQNDAVIFANRIAKMIAEDPLYEGDRIIETGHSLGGNEAQAATVELADAGFTVSAVTFNSPGIGGYPIGSGSYKVLNLYDQADAIHLFGGTHLGESSMLPTGPDPSKLAFGTPLAIASGPVGSTLFLMKAIWDILGPAHSIDTIISYLSGDPLGQDNWPGTGSIALPGDTGSSWASESSDGTLALADDGGNSFQCSVDADGSQKLKWSTNDGYSGSSAVNLDGSSIETATSPEGAATVRTVDISGNIRFETYDADGTLVGSTWNNVDDSVGVITASSANYNSVVKNSDGSMSYTYDALSPNPTVGGFMSTINADKTGSGTSYYADGILASTWTINANGSGSTTGYKRDGSLDYTVTINEDGSLAKTVYGDPGSTWVNSLNANALDIARLPDGTLFMYSANPAGWKSTVQFSSDGSLSSARFYNDADAGASGRYEYSPSNNCALTTPLGGNTTTFYNTTTSNGSPGNGWLGIMLPGGDGSSSYAAYHPDGSIALTSTTNADRSSIRTFYGDQAGSVYRESLDSAGSLLSADRYYADGSYIEYTYSADGSHSEVYHDAFGLLATTTIVDSNGNSTVTGGGGNNTLTGGAGSDTLSGGAGNDMLDGGNGGDTYVFNAGDGVDTIQDSGTTGTDTLAFGQGIVPDSLSLGLGSLLIKVGSGADAIHIKNFNPNNVLGSVNVENFKFADGTVLTYSQLVSRGFDINGSGGDDRLFGTNVVDRLNGLSGNDSLYGGDGNDVLNGGEGDDLLDGGNGNDTYLFGRGDGQDTISSNEWNPAKRDVIRFKEGVSPSDVVVSRDQYNLILKIAGTQDQLTVGSYFYGEGSFNAYGIEAIQFADGSSWDFAAVKAKSLAGTDGNDWLVGTNSGDTIVALDGDDYLEGRGGNDTLVGGAGADTLYGGDGNDILDGGSGDDSLDGGYGNNTYVFGPGAGHDTVVDYGANATVRMMAEVSPEQVAVTRDATNLYLSLNGGADRLALSYWFNGPATKALQVEFADGSAWDAAALLARLPGATAGDDWLVGDGGDNRIDGLGGNDYLWGLGGSDTLSGGIGDDLLQGDAGNDVYLFGPGFGLDTVLDTDTTPGNVDTVQMAAGVLPGDVVVTGDRNNLYLSFVNRADRLTLINWFANDASKVERVSFADGTVWDVAQLAAKGASAGSEVLSGGASSDFLVGSAGNDAIYGMGGADTLTGGAGDDRLIGGYDRDIYLFNLGDGTDVIDDAFSYANNGGYGGSWGGGNGNELRFGVGISPDQVDAISDNGVLTLAVRGTSDRIRLLHWVGGMDRVDRFVFADGTVWDPAHVESIMTPNSAPQLQVPIGRVDANRGKAMSFCIPDGTFADANPADTLTLAVTLEDGNQLPAWLYFNAATHTLYGTPGADDVGTHRVRVTATDPQGIAASDIFDLTVAEAINTAPLLAAPLSDQAAVEDAPFSLTVPTGTFVDNDPGDHLTYSAKMQDGSALASWLAFDTATRTLSGTPGNTEVGVYSICITATDTQGASVADSFNLAVANVNDAPVAALPVANQSVVENAAFSLTLPAGTFNDIDRGDRLAYSATLVSGQPLPSWLKFDAVGASFSGSPGIGNLADYAIRVTAKDLADAAASVDFGLSVVAAPGMSLLGTAGADKLSGFSGNDTLDGGAGADTLIGGKGDDTYRVDNAKDKVIEAKREGNDTIIASVSFELPDNVENLVLTGKTGLKGTGNDLNNTLTGTSGNDTLIGGKGDDIYCVNTAKDKVVEGKAEGKDTIVASIDYALPDNVENLAFTGATGCEGSGNELDNVIRGTAGNDSLDGESGADTLIGGAGNDNYRVDDVGDVVVELAGDGIDSVAASIDYTLPDNVENLTLTGGKALNGTGNALANVIVGNAAANLLDGHDGDDTLTGGAKNDTLRGGPGNDFLYGNAGNDVLDGGAGLDFLEGSNGDDTLADSLGSGYFNGGAGDDKLTGGTSADFFAGGEGDDSIATGGGNDVAAFNRGDGHDQITVGAGGSLTLSLGGGITYGDLKFKKSGDDLVLQTGNDDEAVEFTDWYARSAKHNVLNLQMIAEAMDGFDAKSKNPLLSKKVQDFDFTGLVNAFDTARAANSRLSTWTLSSALAQFHLTSSDTAALGGDLAYQYGKNGTLAGIGLAAAQTVLGDAQFGSQAQALRPLADLRDGAVHLG